MTIGNKIYELRKKTGISQEELAQKINVSRQAVSKWERDETIPDTDKIIALSSVFCISTDYLLLDYIENEDLKKEPIIENTSSNKWKSVIGGVSIAFGLFLGFLGGLGLFVWSYLINSSPIPPTPDIQPIFSIIKLLLIGSIVVALPTLIVGIILLKSYRKEEK